MQIAFLGDSLTEGWPGAAYFPLLQRRLPQHELLNLGRAGDTVVDLLRRVTRRSRSTTVSPARPRLSSSCRGSSSCSSGK